MKLVYFSVTSNEIPNLSEAIRLLAQQMEPLTVYARTRTQLENNPDRGYIEDLEAYRSSLDPEKPTVDIWFYQNFWTSNNKAHIDAMVGEVESQGANVICVFHMRFKDTLLGNQGPDYVVEHFFMKDGRPAIDRCGGRPYVPALRRAGPFEP